VTADWPSALPASCSAAALALFSTLDARGVKLVLAESCTGGLAAAALTEIAGSSRVFWGGIVSYSEEAKEGLLGVPQSTITAFGVVSRETAEAMARGALKASSADIAAAVSGYAGPEAPEGENGPGRVCFAWATRTGSITTDELRFGGPRAAVREAACLRLLTGSVAAAVEAFPARY
jgi:nicotinamide-nucleotide amidase